MMEQIQQLLLILISSALVSNVVLSQFLGLCPFLGVSKKEMCIRDRICSRECADTYFIQTLDDLHLDLPKSVRLVGITAGASTPNKIIEEVQNYVRINF